MLKKMGKNAKKEKPGAEERKIRLQEATQKLVGLQTAIKENKLPIVVLVEGWGAAGKGSAIANVIRDMDPRFFNVITMPTPTKEEQRYPFLHRYFTKIPEAGKFVFFDSGWLDELAGQMVKGELSDKKYEQKVESIRLLERQLTDDGYLVVKFFFQITAREQAKRLEELEEDKDTAWRVSAYDKWQNRHYEKCREVFEKCLADTQSERCPWHIVDAQDKKWAALQVMETLCRNIEEKLKTGRQDIVIQSGDFRLKQIPLLKEIDLGQTIEEKEYKKELEKLQNRLGELHNRLYRRKVPVVIVYEGWDAAGKGGNIRRMAAALDPRGYEVHPIASPQPYEKARHFLWRFWTRLPKTGHIAIFDRSWYGRVMVERLEGFCSENDWRRAYNEINEFEKELSDWGAVIVKFWVQIDKDTQLARFNDRQNNPEKRWKITDEDWRNREKWDQYEGAVDEMLQKTSTTYAPWYILESVDKKYARIKALKIMIRALEEALDE